MTNISVKSLDSKVKKHPPSITITYDWNGDPNWRQSLAQVYAIILAAAERERERAVNHDRPA